MSGSLFTQDTRTKARNAAERRFRTYGLGAIILALLALVWLLISIFSAGLPAFRQTFITFPVKLEESVIDKAVQMFGGMGVVSGMPVEELYREIRPLRIYEGASEVQKLVIARQLLSGAGAS